MKRIDIAIFTLIIGLATMHNNNATEIGSSQKVVSQKKSKGLSTGAKIGIGIGAAVAGAALAAGGAAAYHHLNKDTNIEDPRVVSGPFNVQKQTFVFDPDVSGGGYWQHKAIEGTPLFTGEKTHPLVDIQF